MHRYRIKTYGAPGPVEPMKNMDGTGSEWKHTTDGYLQRFLTIDGRAVRQLQHRVVMAEIVGRPLLPNETVHHKNGVRDDNRPKNLELWASTQPKGQRVEDLVEWANEIIVLYSGLQLPSQMVA